MKISSALKTALGMQALLVTHGIFDFRTADKSFKEDGKDGKMVPKSKRHMTKWIPDKLKREN